MYGKLSVICGPMYAGKTTLFLQKLLWARNGLNKKVLAIKPAFDNRYSDSKVVSHDGLSAEVESISSWVSVQAQADEAAVVFMDEVQFFCAPNFDGDIVAIVRSLLEEGKEVVVNGLDMDWRGMPFEVTARLAAMADQMHKLTAHCSVCGKNAGKTYKKVVNDAQVELGAGDLYEARCNKHWEGEHRAEPVALAS